MKKILFLSFCLFLGAATLHAQKTLYFIDNEAVVHFDGSQLKGKLIRDYKITTSGEGRNAITVHSITTSRVVSHEISVSDHAPNRDDYVLIIDGERKDASLLTTVPVEDIQLIKVIRAGSPEALVYGKNVSVIIVTTKKKD